MGKKKPPNLSTERGLCVFCDEERTHPEKEIEFCGNRMRAILCGRVNPDVLLLIDRSSLRVHPFSERLLEGW